MTLVVGIEEDGAVLLIGDMLVTKVGGDVHKPLPVLPEIQERFPPEFWGFTSAGLVRKIGRINDALVVAISGGFDECLNVCRKIEAAAAVLTDQAAVTSLLDGVGSFDGDLLGIIKTPAWPKLFQYDFRIGEFSFRARAFVGSGAEAAKQAVEGGVMFLRKQYRTQTEFLYSIGAATILSLLGDEAWTGDSIASRFGGAYDAVVWDRHGIHDLPSTTFVFLSYGSDVEGKAVRSAAPFFVNQAKIGGEMFVRGLSTIFSDGTLHLDPDRTYRIHFTESMFGFESNLSRAEFEQFCFSNFSAEIIGVFSLIRNPDGRCNYAATVFLDPDEAPVKFGGMMDDQTIAIEEDFGEISESLHSLPRMSFPRTR